MTYWQFYSHLSSWKRPYHVAKAYIAKYWAKLFSRIEIIAITGSVGKTTAKEATISVLRQKYPTIGSVANLDPIFNIPRTLLKIRPWTKKVVLEFGVEYPSDMDFYLDLIKPRIGCVTRVYWTHTQFLKNLDGVIAKKGKLLESLPKDGYAILNYDDDKIREVMAKKTQAQLFWFGENKKADLTISDFSNKNYHGSSFKLNYQNQQVEINWRLIGQQQTIAAAVAASVGVLSGLSLSDIKNGLEKLQPQPQRFNIIETDRYSIIDDTYNSSPIAVIEALKTLGSFPAQIKIVVLSDMKELGKYSQTAHREIASSIFDVAPYYVWLIGDQVQHTRKELANLGFAKSRVEHASLKQAGIFLQGLKNEPLILIKGSRHTHLERLVNLLAGKSTTINCPVCGQLSIND